jgi:hypothetical protein
MFHPGAFFVALSSHLFAILSIEQGTISPHQSQGEGGSNMTKFYIRYIHYALSALATVAFGLQFN